MLDVKPSDLADTIIQGSCFCRHEPYSQVFPEIADGMCILLDCNVDNCVIPKGYVISGTTTNKHFKQQKDKEFWIVDKGLAPVEPRDSARFDALGLSKDPKGIPAQALDVPITAAAYIVEQAIEEARR